MYAYALTGLVAGLATFLIAGETPPERRARVWSLIIGAAVLWWAALLYVAWIVADELKGAPKRPARTAARPVEA